jgi:hypothetical protein
MSSRVPYVSDPVTPNYYDAWMAAHQSAVDAHAAHQDSENQLMEKVQPAPEY